MDIYSRSYGSIETEPKERTISLPPDYNGSLYREPPMPRPEENDKTPEKQETKQAEEKEEKPLCAPFSEKEKNTGAFRSILEKISAEDLILFILILSILLGDADDNGTVLAVILAILLT